MVWGMVWTSVLKAPRLFKYAVKFQNHHFRKIILESVFVKLDRVILIVQKALLIQAAHDKNLI